MDRQPTTQIKATEQVATRIKAETYGRLRELAKREDRSIAAQVRRLIEREVDGELKEAA